MDFSDTQKIADRLMSATARLQKMVPEVAHARQVKSFLSDIRKNLLAKYVVSSLKGGESSAAAEAIGRADPQFQRELGALQEQYVAAEEVLAQWDAENASYEAARSLLSYSRETLRTMPE